MWDINAIKCILLLTIVCQTFARKGVPVLLWSPNRAPSDYPIVSALQQISYPAFQADFVNSFNTDKILMFLQDELSVEDITNHPDELKTLSKWLESSHSVYLPSVDNPSFMMHDFPSHGYEVKTLQPGSEQAGITLKNNTKTLLVVKLPATVTNPSRKNALQKADEVVDSVISKIGGLADFLVIFTAKKSSIVMHDYPAIHSRVRRSLEMDLPGYHYSDCVLLYLKNSFVLNRTKDGDTQTLVIPEGNHEDVGDCANYANVMLKILYKEVEGINKLHVTLNFVRHRTSWTLVWAEIYEQVKGFNNANLYPTKKMALVPLGKAYTCSSKILLKSASSEEIQYSMLIPEMQVEAFTNKRRRFSQSWDCVGFLTVPIWAGWFTATIFGSVLVLGLTMILNLKTTDRFDDLKTAHVHVASVAE